VVFVGTFTAGKLEVMLERRATADRRGRQGEKVRQDRRTPHLQRPQAQKKGMSVLYVTERCVFRLCAEGLELIEIAPGVDLQKDILDRMDFVPVMLDIRSHADIERVRQAVIDKLAPLGHKVYAIVNYDRFSILPELVDDYVEMVRVLMETCYHDVTRFTSNTFFRARLGEALEKGKVAAQSYETAAEAEARLRRQ
jgi:propionate CoA-transferase